MYLAAAQLLYLLHSLLGVLVGGSTNGEREQGLVGMYSRVVVAEVVDL